MPAYRFAVLGDPIDHSRSPELHRAMLDLAGLEGDYLKVEADDRVLEAEVERLRAGEWDGLNITMPLKASAARLADSVSPRAARAGSVNTLSRSNSEIHGESTDATTFHELIHSGRFEDRSSILVLGSGGSAAAALSAVDDDETVYLAARRSSPAETLTARLGGEVVSWGTAVAGALLINSTPIGMRGEELPPGLLDAASGLIDLPYGESVTPAIRLAREMNIDVADGHEFLLRQAIASFRLWTGVDIDHRKLATRLRKA